MKGRATAAAKAHSQPLRRIQARIGPKELELIKRAADATGTTLSDFVATAARDAATRQLGASNRLQLVAREQRRFVELLLNPPRPSKALKRAAAAHAKLITR